MATFFAPVVLNTPIGRRATFDKSSQALRDILGKIYAAMEEEDGKVGEGVEEGGRTRKSALRVLGESFRHVG